MNTVNLKTDIQELENTLSTIRSELIEALQLDALSVEEQNQIIGELGEIIFREAVSRSIEEMEDKDAEAFSVFMDAGPDEAKMLQYLTDKVSGFGERLEEVGAEILLESGAFMQAVLGGGNVETGQTEGQQVSSVAK
jgi:hypothetical protein